MFADGCVQKRMFVAILTVLLFMGFGIANVNAQLNSNATISGTVTDSSGSAIAGAMVTVKNAGTGVTNMTVSDAQGRYSVADLIIGTYEVDVEATGFKRYSHGGITLTVGGQVVVDAPMEVGTVQQTITVESDVSHVETTSAAVTTLVQEVQLVNLPLQGRNYYDLVQLSPGVVANPSGGGLKYGNQTNYTVSGGRAFGQAYLVDDTDTADFWDHSTGNGATGTQLGVDSIAEFQTMLNTYGAQFGGNGAAFNASTKSGTNSFHGTVYEFNQNSAFNASSTYVPTLTAQPKPFLNQNQFGFSLGGPVKKNKLFFFVNYEALRKSTSTFSALSVPDLNARGCPDLATCLADNGVGPTPQIQNSQNKLIAIPFAPCNGGNSALFPNSAYPLGNGCTAQVSAKALLSLIPIGTLGTPSTSGNMLTPNVASPIYTHENYVVSRVDYTISDKDTVFGKLTSDTAKVLDTQNSSSYGYLPLTSFDADTYITIEERRIFSPTLLNSFHVSYVRPNTNASQYGQPIVNSFGNFQNCFGCTTNSPTYEGPTSPLRIAAAPLGLAAGGTQTFYLKPNHWTIGDDVVWTKGSHSLKMGIMIERLDENTESILGSSGTFAFTALTTIAGVCSGATPCPTGTLAGFIEGAGSSVGTATAPSSLLKGIGLSDVDGTVDSRQTLFQPYFQDDWKLSSRITLNLGVRYSPSSNPVMLDRHQRQNLLNAPWSGAAFGSTVTSVAAPGIPAGTNCANPNGVGTALSCGFVPITHPFVTTLGLRNIDPRIGVAWDPFKDHKTSVRAGFGIYHSVVLQRDYDYWLDPPFVTLTENLTTAANPPGSPSNYPFQFAGTNGFTPVCTLPGTFGAVTIQPANAVPATFNQAWSNCVSASNTADYSQTNTPYQIQYNMTVQREVMPSTIVSVGFVGNRGVHLIGQADRNPMTACGGTDAATNSPIYTIGYVSSKSAWEPCPRLNTAYSSLQLTNADMESWYNALQISANRRLSHGFQTQLSYTWSRSVDMSDGVYGLDGAGSVSNPTSWQSLRGVNGASRNQNFRLSGLYTLPFHRNQLVAGWQVSGIYTYLSGLPFTVSGLNRSGYGQSANWTPNAPGCNNNPYTGASPQQGVNVYTSGTIGSIGSSNTLFSGPTAATSLTGGTTGGYLNANCFGVVAPGEVGNLGRNTFYGPGGWSLNMSVLKDTRITKISEQFDIQFRAEFFNIMNHPTWGTPSGTSLWSLCTTGVGCTLGGINTSGSAAVGANNAAIGFGAFGNPSSQPRTLQFGLKVLF